MADIDGGFAAIVEARADAVITFSDTVTFNFANQVAELASEKQAAVDVPISRDSQSPAA